MSLEANHAVRAGPFLILDDGSRAAAAVGRDIRQRYSGSLPSRFILAIGGNREVIRALHFGLTRKLPVFGMSLEESSFLTNRYSGGDLVGRLAAAQVAPVSPLLMTCEIGTVVRRAIAFNEVSVFRATRKMASLRLSLDRRCALDALLGDGLLVCTPLGSTAYNLSLDGPILPLGSNTLAITPVAPAKPRGWPGALVPAKAVIKIETLEADWRPIVAAADFLEVRDAELTTVVQDTQTVQLLFDAESFRDRQMREQFSS